MIGIDLGTTHSSLAQFDEGQKSLEQLKIQEDFLFPSALYFPTPEEGSSPWVGFKALERGSEVPDRLVTSAKSWLAHNGIDRKSALLPLEHDEKISPFDTTVLFLKEIKKSCPSDAHVTLTVPASFDPAARELTQEAAKAAGFKEITLIEEPIAAFYAWLQDHSEDWRKSLKVGDQILVVDVGGGTTDFSLIEVGESEGRLDLKKSAVGNHLLLGGDNLDYAIAHFIEEKLDRELDDWQRKALVLSARKVKEKLLGEKAPAKADVVIPGRGSKLIGGSIKQPVTKEEIEALLVGGFFPIIPFSGKSKPEKRAGLNTLGLPYVQDPRITAQLALFLTLGKEVDEPQAKPTHILFNGGTFKAKPFREQILKQLEKWLGKEVTELQGVDLDFAVSRGAAYYGFAKTGKGIRVKGGVSRSFFIGIEEAAPAIPGREPPMQALCILPFGSEEGTTLEFKDRVFHLTVGEKAIFRFFKRSAPTLSDGKEVEPGTLIRKWKGELEEIESFETCLEGKPDEKGVAIYLKSELTELGILNLYALAQDGRKWKLELNLRQNLQP